MMETEKEPTVVNANNRPFEHCCSNGTKFRCERADLREPITVSNRPSSWKSVCEDVAEFIGFHAVNIWPDLNGFSGYDTLDFDWRRNR